MQKDKVYRTRSGKKVNLFLILFCNEGDAEPIVFTVKAGA